MKLFYIVLACTALVGGPQLRAAPAVPEARIQELITQLADADFQKREAASQELKRIGKPALPALQAVAQHEDPEVRVRVAELIEALQPAPAAPAQPQVRLQGGQILRFGGVGGARIQMRAVALNNVQMNAVTTSSFEKDGKKYEVTRTTNNDVTKISVRITETKDNKPVERVVEADSDAALAKKEPALAKILAEQKAAEAQAVEVNIGGCEGAEE